MFWTEEVGVCKYGMAVWEAGLSDRLDRVALQQAAGIAKSWRTNRQAAYEAYLEDLAEYAEARAKAEISNVSLDPNRQEPSWKEWNLPELRVPCLQANANVVVVEKAQDKRLTISCASPRWTQVI